jgi:hypothetical protein
MTSPEPATTLSALDLVLGEGTPAERAEALVRLDADPAAVLEVAEAVAFVEHWRGLAAAPGPTYGPRLLAIVQRAERSRGAPAARAPRAPWWRQGWWGLAAAAAVFAALCAWDPLAHRRQGPPANLRLTIAAPGPAPATMPEVPLASEVARRADLAQMRQRLGQEASPHLRDALEAGLVAAGDPLGRWLEPRNNLALASLDHELRASAELRRQALQRLGGTPAADVRAQELAEAIGRQLLAALVDGEAAMAAVAAGLRALIAAGPGSEARGAARHAASGWIAARLPQVGSVDLVHGLAAMVEMAALDGDRRALVRRQGQRLVAAILTVDDENWRRRLPELLGPRAPVGVLAEAGRVLHLLPGFGVDGESCDLARELLLGALRERRRAGADDAALFAGLLYGFGDRLHGDEREQVELRLRRWKASRLGPDYAIVQQMAWGIAPGSSGFTRMQAELRQVAASPDPLELAPRAALCLCLATSYAAFAGTALPRLAGGS